ncbi:MAG: hypothetical protein BVN35_04350 [Proteobacteria bacterium ST_bin11]|nr:MAG: hypothetical protein BVN35_04350 [Proteobacteria bacterium ST_bin11]
MPRAFFTAVILYSLNLGTSFALGVGEEAPACDSANSLATEKFSAQSYRGKVLLVDFWATWCPPCKKSMPFLNRIRNALSAKGFEVVAINVDENSGEAQAYLTQNPVDYPQFFDPSGGCPETYSVKAMPSSYLIDKSGKVRMIHLGFRDEDKPELERSIAGLLTE